MKFLECNCGDRWKDEAYFVLRLITGLLFFTHGHAKVFGEGGVDAVAGFFASAGVPAAGLVAFIVAYGELLGGLALMAGFFTHWVAKLNIVIILGAIWFVHLENGYSGPGGFEYSLLILGVNLLILASGSGKYSLDARRRASNAM